MKHDDLDPKGAYCELSSLCQLRFAARDMNLFSRTPARSQLSGGLRTRIRGRGMDFEEVRLYQAGDDVRTIDWRVTARTQVTHTKIFREERERPIFMILDQRSPMFFGSRQCFKSVLGAHIGSLLSWAALEQGDRIGGLIFGDQQQRDVRARRSKHAVLELLHRIHDFNHQLNNPVAEEPSQPLAAVLADTRRLAKPGSALFIISDFHDFDAHCEQQLFELSRHSDLTLIHVYDPIEKHLASSASLALSDGRERCQIPAQDKGFQQAYRANFEHNLEQLVLSCQRLKLPLLTYSTTDPIQTLMRERFGKRRKSRPGKPSTKPSA
ncbi:DUF58 domain-containing protein [Marinimicrobium sp. ABcell2]|uniref:DUF58 domain-containing protein n=1 Tax=Marinimicrobium sp. ABcell2 TaxID=3069751 RepID=UPI0027B779B0|nr:DUF58 domain-containing protein [Marinimicrobium sp. ABcell2]MDQ2075621.1 DUF58 domain-containing protein [Marinimicrobium sp. ABcell2]